MRHTRIRRLLILLALLGVTTSAPAQHDPAGVPVFANDPAMPTGPEFCPPSPHPVIRTPFDGFENPRPNAFTEPCEDGPGEPCLIYFGGGALAIQRNSLSRGVIAVRDPGINIPGIPPNVDTGIPPPADSPVAARFNSVPRDYHWGGLMTLGIQKGRHAVELHGWYIGEQSNRAIIADPGRLSLPFGNFPFPLGFEGNNNLWLQADQVTLELQTRLANAELNYRYLPMPQFEWIFGARYVDLREIFGITTDDDGLVVQPQDPFRIATYRVQTQNRFVGGQFGFELNQFVAEKLSLGMTSKNMIGPNFFEVENRLIRGDGFERPPGRRTGTNISGLVEVGLHATIWFNPRFRLKGGYQALWLLNVPEAADQVNFDPNESLGTIDDRGTIFYHGPRIEVQFAF